MSSGSAENLTIEHRILLAALRRKSDEEAMAILRNVLQQGKVYRDISDAKKAHSRPRVRSKQLEKRLSLLRAKNEEREYAVMVQDVSAASLSAAQTESARLGRYGAQMSIGANVLVTMITCFVAGYFAFKHSSGSQNAGLAGGMVCMIIAMAVEATLVITRMYSIESAAEKDVRKRTKQMNT